VWQQCNGFEEKFRFFVLLLRTICHKVGLVIITVGPSYMDKQLGPSFPGTQWTVLEWTNSWSTLGCICHKDWTFFRPSVHGPKHVGWIVKDERPADLASRHRTFHPAPAPSFLFIWVRKPIHTHTSKLNHPPTPPSLQNVFHLILPLCETPVSTLSSPHPHLKLWSTIPLHINSSPSYDSDHSMLSSPSDFPSISLFILSLVISSLPSSGFPFISLPILSLVTSSLPSSAFPFISLPICLYQSWTPIFGFPFQESPSSALPCGFLLSSAFSLSFFSLSSCPFL
jgi:hypothetical protein